MLNQSEQGQLLQKLKTLHSDDKKQLEAIFSNSKRLIIEAPAGYGKTKTMISKIAYLLATGQISNPKKVLALTFSVNAAFKIKKELSENLPHLLEVENSNNFKVSDKLFVSNYHGFCRHILKTYGYLLHSNLQEIDLIKSVDDSKTEEITRIFNISYDAACVFSAYSDAIKNVNRQYLNDSFNQYTDGIIRVFLDKRYISFNGIIALTLKIFIKYPEVLQFYQDYFPVIIVDEFQDTNILSWSLLRTLVSDKSQLVFIGDSLQRIYGFIGAIPDLMIEAEQRFSMERISLENNYRFMKNPQMLQLDKNIRLNAENSFKPAIHKNAEVPLILAVNQLNEAELIIKKINDLWSANEEKTNKIAILTRGGATNCNTRKIIDVFNQRGISYFYGLFNEDSPEYLEFHQKCSSLLTEQLRIEFRISQKIIKSVYSKVKEFVDINKKPTFTSLLNLLDVFLFKVLPSYSFLSIEDKLLLIRDAFDNKNLKQNMEHISEDIIVSTIHGAKGLEWDYVFIPDMEQYSMPNWYGLCGDCNYKSNCKLKIQSTNEKKFIEELSVFYVGVTRARKQIFFSASKERLKADGNSRQTNLSCMLGLPGITLIK